MCHIELVKAKRKVKLREIRTLLILCSVFLDFFQFVGDIQEFEKDLKKMLKKSSVNAGDN